MRQRGPSRALKQESGRREWLTARLLLSRGYRVVVTSFNRAHRRSNRTEFESTSRETKSKVGGEKGGFYRSRPFETRPYRASDYIENIRVYQGQNRAILRSRGEVVEGKRSNHFSPSHTSQPNSELAKIDSDASNRFGGRYGKPSVTFCAILAVIDLSFLSISQPRFKRTLHQQGLASR